MSSSLDLVECAKRLRRSLLICDRSRGTFRRHIYHNCFVAKEAVTKLIALGAASDRKEAEKVGNDMIKKKILHGCSSSDRDSFKDGDHLYRFECDRLDVTVEKTEFGPSFKGSLLWRFSPHIKSNSLFLTYALAEKLEAALALGTKEDIANTMRSVRKRILKAGCFDENRVLRRSLGEDPRFEDCEWIKVGKNAQMSTTWQLKGVEHRDFVVNRISGTLGLSPQDAIEMLAEEEGRKKYEPRIQKMTTVDPLQNIRRRTETNSVSRSSVLSISQGKNQDKLAEKDDDTESKKADNVSAPKLPIQKHASITSKGDRLIVYCKGLVKEQLEKGNTVKYNNIKRSVIEKFDRETYDMYKDEVREICRDSTLNREKQIRHRISRSSTVSTTDSATSPTPAPSDLDISQSAPPALPSMESSIGDSESSKSSDIHRSMTALSKFQTKSGRTLSESMNLMGLSSSSEPIRNLIIKYINVKFKSSRWAQRDCVVLRDVFSVSDGRCVLWEVSVQHKKVPQRDGFMRMTVHGNVYVAEPIPGQPKKCRLTRTTQVTYSGSNTTPQIADAQSLFDNMMEDARVTKGVVRRKTELIDFEVLSVLGKGGYGKVYQVRHKSSGGLYAMKSISKAHTVEKRQVKGIKAERQILLRVTHPYIVHMAWAFQTRSSLYFVMEFVKGGDLLSLITKWRKGLPETLARIYAAEIALALNHLHSKKIVYRDMKPENILIGADGHLKIADFGVSYIQNSNSIDEGPKTFVGTEVYMAPEIINEAIKLQRAAGKQVRKARSSYGCRVDWWSFGIVFYEIITARHPFLSRDRLKTIRRIIKYYKPNISKISKEAGRLVLGLLRREPDRRYGFSQIKTHPYFEGFDWKALEEYTLKIPDECLPVNLVKVAEAKLKDKPTKKKSGTGDDAVTNQLTKELEEEAVGVESDAGDESSFFEHEDLFDGFDYSE